MSRDSASIRKADHGRTACQTSQSIAATGLHRHTDDCETIEPLKQLIEGWRDELHRNQLLTYVARVNRWYDTIVKSCSSRDLTEVRLMRSIWAKKLVEQVTRQISAPGRNITAFLVGLNVLRNIRGCLPLAAIHSLTDWQQARGSAETATELTRLISDFSDPTLARQAAKAFVDSKRVGPMVVTKFRPVRKSARSFDPTAWLHDPKMSAYQFVDDDPDRVTIRGIELRSGDMGIVELNYVGDGITECYLNETPLAPHAMVYVSRRVPTKSGSVLIQPSLVEIYEGGWRCVPLSTGLSSHFSWYSEWVRPGGLPADFGTRASQVLDKLQTVTFDFQSRKCPAGGVFTSDFGPPSATCSNFLRIIFERAGVDLPYTTTEVAERARKNLQLIGIDINNGIYTPTNILRDPQFLKVGIIDNGLPEVAFAQALVNGRPDWPESVGGYLSTRNLQLERLPDWRSVGQWRSALESIKLAVGTSKSLLGALSRSAFGYKLDEIPTSAPPAAIVFYLRSQFIAAHIIETVALPLVQKWFRENGSYRLSNLRADETIRNKIRDALAECELATWYD